MEVKQIMQKDFLKFAPETELSKVVGALKKNKKRSAVVLDASKFLGIVSRRELLNRKYSGSSKVANITLKTPIVLDDLDLSHCLQLMAATSVDTLPVEKNGKLVGVVRAIDVLKQLSLELESAKKRVKEVTLVRPSPLDPKDPVSKAVSTMLKEKADTLLVFDKKTLLGVLSLGDVVELAAQSQSKISNPAKRGSSGRPTRAATVGRDSALGVEVSSLMTKGPLLTVTRDHKLSDAVALMHKKDVMDLIVQEDDKVFGVITVKQLLSAFAEEQFKPELKLQIKGMGKLDMHDLQEERMVALIRSETSKLQRVVGEDVAVNVHMKEYSKSGAAHKFEVKLKVESSAGRFMSEAVEWKLNAAIKGAFNALALEAKKSSNRNSDKQTGRARSKLRK